MAATRANVESFNVGDTFLTKYQIRGLIGRGGQAMVYHSYDTFIDRDVAIKIMTDVFDSRREHSRRAQMEARVLCRLQHHNIVHVYDAGMTDNGSIYIIMELLKGRTLRDVLRDIRRLTVYEALSLGAQIADGVEVAHRQQVIHRDLKPENIFVVDGNVTKVLDFGIAKFLTLTGITTQRDTLQGTMWYISPEHVQGFGVTARSDIYALGSILYELICGTPACLVGLEEISTQSVAWSQIARVPPQLDEVMPEVPPYVGRLVQRMLVKDPKDRPASMAEVAEALRAACRRLHEEANRHPMVLRDLWYDTHLKTVAPGAASAELDSAKTSRDSNTPNLMQPTIEVRDPRAVVSSNPEIGIGLAVAESGIVVPNAGAFVVRPSDGAAPVRTPNAAGLDAIEASAEADSFSPAKRVILNRRLLTVAVVIGVLLGLGLGLSGRFSSKLGQVRQSTSSEPGALTTVSAAHEQLSAVSSAPLVSGRSQSTVDAPTAASASSTTPPEPSSSTTSALLSTRGRVPAARRSPLAIPPPADRGADRKKATDVPPQPRYSGSDLE